MNLAAMNKNLGGGAKLNKSVKAIKKQYSETLKYPERKFINLNDRSPTLVVKPLDLSKSQASTQDFSLNVSRKAATFQHKNRAYTSRLTWSLFHFILRNNTTLYHPCLPTFIPKPTWLTLQNNFIWKMTSRILKNLINQKTTSGDKSASASSASSCASSTSAQSRSSASMNDDTSHSSYDPSNLFDKPDSKHVSQTTQLKSIHLALFLNQLFSPQTELRLR